MTPLIRRILYYSVICTYPQKVWYNYLQELSDNNEVVRMFIRQPFDDFLDMDYSRTDDIVEVSMPIKALHINSVGVIHGGLISTLADVAMGNLIPTNNPGVQELVTVDLKVSFLKPAKGDYLLARATPVKNGKKLVFAQCEIYNNSEDLVDRGSWHFFKNIVFISTELPGILPHAVYQNFKTPTSISRGNRSKSPSVGVESPTEVPKFGVSQTSSLIH